MTWSTESSSPTAADALWALPAQCDDGALLQLQTFLLAHRDRAICLDASDLRRLDTIILQIGVAACRDWSARGLPFRMVNLPDRLLSALPQLGLEPEALGIEAQQ